MTASDRPAAIMDLVDTSSPEEFPFEGDEELKPTPAPEPNAVEKPDDEGIGQIFRSAARLTAEFLMVETENLAALDPNHPSALEEELSKAQMELSEGDARALANDDETAIQHYRKAWMHASVARLHVPREL